MTGKRQLQEITPPTHMRSVRKIDEHGVYHDTYYEEDGSDNVQLAFQVVYNPSKERELFKARRTDKIRQKTAWGAELFLSVDTQKTTQ